MDDFVSDNTFQEALDNCASEEIKAPGIVQDCGCVVAFEARTGEISHASANSERFVGYAPDALIGEDINDIFGSEISHAVNNAQSLPTFNGSRVALGRFKCQTGDVQAAASKSGDRIVLEFESAETSVSVSMEAMRTLTYLIEQIRTATTEDELFQKTVSLLQRLTGYDRVCAMKFDAKHNGTVIAEKATASLESLIGLRFPHWDIPPNALEVMSSTPLRYIYDSEQEPVQLCQAEGAPALEMTFAQLRGVSPIHLQYLRNMSVRGSMTLSLVVEGKLWGVIPFHSSRPRVPSFEIRALIETFLPVLLTQVQSIRQTEQLKMADELEIVKTDIFNDTELDRDLSSLAPHLASLFKADGAALLTADGESNWGRVPNAALLREIYNYSMETAEIESFENLKEAFPGFEEEINGVAGCLITPLYDKRAIVVFRDIARENLKWAGAPKKDIAEFEGKARLQPRASFSIYLEEIGERCEPWRQKDYWIARKLWTLLNAAERRSLINTINRQQLLMIDELNHRVRNILSLIRSVSRQARLHYSSLDSYTVALEARIHALAAAHDMGSGGALAAVSLKRMIVIEAEPFVVNKEDRVRLHGVDRSIEAASAPLFALVIHELITNSAKYGALSGEAGFVDVTIMPKNNGIELEWRETGGPTVRIPNQYGFGTNLIRQAVPYELNGSSELEFLPEGVLAQLWLPNSLFEEKVEDDAQEDLTNTALLSSMKPKDFSQKQRAIQILVLEDNFMIATDLSDVLEYLGFTNIEIAGNEARAREICKANNIELAVLDVNLGRGQTTFGIAAELREAGMPIIFVTGYGEQLSPPEGLDDALVLTKPISIEDLRSALSKIL